MLCAAISPAQDTRIVQADRGSDGNRLVAAPLPLAGMRSTTLSLPEAVVWSTARSTDAGPEWYVRTADGRAYRISVNTLSDGDGAAAGPRAPVVRELELPPSRSPVSLRFGANGTTTATAFAPPAPDALPDAHLAVTSAGDRVYLADPTTRYPHGVLGDRLEATTIVVKPPGGPETRIALDLFVAEERGVLLDDLDGDGREEIVTVLTERAAGAFIAAYSLEGEMVARGAPVGAGFRWRHLVGAGPLGTDGERLIAVIRTPHIGGVVEYYDRNLEIVARVGGYSSHAIGSANLGDAFIADVNEDGRAELIAPVQSRNRLHAISLTAAGPEVVWQYGLPSGLSGNLSVAYAADETDGRPGLLVAERDGTVHLWW